MGISLHFNQKTPAEWRPAEEKDYLEVTYQEFLKGGYVRERVFHSFGNGASVGVDFKYMKTHGLSKHRNEIGTINGYDGVFLVRRI